MGRQYDFETRDRAEDLYICQGFTLEQVAAATGVSLSQVKEWSTTESWRERREEYRQALREIRMNTIRLRRGLIEKALFDLDPQRVYAAASMERVAQLAEKAAAVKGKPEDLSEAPSPAAITREIRTPEQAITALQEAAEARLNLLLSQPGELSLVAVKDVQKVLALIDELKNKYQPQDKSTAGKGLSEEAADEIRRKILGIKG